jgi:transposase-like protein
MSESEPKPKCVQCGSDRVAEVLYGLVRMDEGLTRDIEAGRVVLGGDIIREGGPEWVCQSCHHKWGNIRERFNEILKRRGYK